VRYGSQSSSLSSPHANGHHQGLDACDVGKSQRMSLMALFLLLVPFGMEIDMSSVINAETPREWHLRDNMLVLWVTPYAGLVGGLLIAAATGDRWGRRTVLYLHRSVWPILYR